MKKINILDISSYMICPPISGGALRILAPFAKMSADCGLEVDMLFSSHAEDHIEQCKTYLEKIPVINDAVGVISAKHNTLTEGMPENVSPDVYITISEELKLKAVEMVSQKKYDIIQIEHSQLSWIVPFLRLASPASKIVLDLHNAEHRIFETWLPHA